MQRVLVLQWRDNLFVRRFEYATEIENGKRAKKGNQKRKKKM